MYLFCNTQQALDFSMPTCSASCELHGLKSEAHGLELLTLSLQRLRIQINLMCICMKVIGRRLRLP